VVAAARTSVTVRRKCSLPQLCLRLLQCLLHGVEESLCMLQLDVADEACWHGQLLLYDVVYAGLCMLLQPTLAGHLQPAGTANTCR
jgi:hypothetical protein